MGREISELGGVEFTGSLSEAFHDYGGALERVLQRLAFELELASGDAEAAMAGLHGKWWLLGLDVRVKARTVSDRLRRAQEGADTASRRAMRIYRSYRRNFPEAARREED
jgi:hypothetical protein